MTSNSDTHVLLTIPDTVPATFLSRPNRFLLVALITGSKETVRVHVPDPGRLKELLYHGNRLLLTPATGVSSRKTNWSLVGAMDATGWILVNTTYHRKIATSLFMGSSSPFGIVNNLSAEVKSPSGHSRFDFLLNYDLWVEVKGCTLKKGKEALFPDAPTTRGVKHLTELTTLAMSGLKTAVVFLVFVRDVDYFTVNRTTDIAFAKALEKAVVSGVSIYPIQISFNGRDIEYVGLLDLVMN